MSNPFILWYNLLVFVPYYFSMGTLMATFFTPWKRYYWKKKHRGLHIGESLYILVSNLVSRFIGVILRIIILFCGFLATFSAVIFGLPLALIISVINPRSFLFQPESFSEIRGIAWDWHYGYTPLTDEFSRELFYSNLEVPLIGRDREQEGVMRVLTADRTKNILLIGEPGSGRQALLTHLAHTYSSLRFLVFDWMQCVKQLTDETQKKAKLEDILFEVRHAGNVVLIIPDIHELTTYSHVFEQYINRPDLHVIGLSTPNKYHELILPNESFMKHFITIDTNPLPKNIILQILTSKIMRSTNSTRASAMLSPEILEIIYSASLRLSSTEQKHQPEAALSLLSEFLSFIKQKEQNRERYDLSKPMRMILEEFIEERLEIPVGALSDTEKETLKHLEEKLHERIIGQDEAVDEIAGALRRRQLKLTAENKPIGSFLFLGPSGVGKTETTKALAELFFQHENKLLRFDMSQYQHESQMEDLITQLAKAIRETPYAVLLLDEIEKANTSILNLFLTIVDEGYFTDNNQSMVLCSNLIIIGTSNAASEFIREHLQDDTNHEKHARSFNTSVINYVLEQHIFSPEFINRFDAVVVYTPLSTEHLKQIARIKLETLRNRIQKEHQKTFTISDDMITKVVSEGVRPEFGARELDRTIRRLVEEPLAEKLLSN